MSYNCKVISLAKEMHLNYSSTSVASYTDKHKAEALLELITAADNLCSAEGVKNIKVRVEDIETGEIVKDFDCGIDSRRAERLEDSLISRTNLERYHVYQSVSI